MLYPHAGNNSIQSATVIVEWESELSTEDIKAMKPRIDELTRQHFSNSQTQKIVQMNIGGPVTSHIENDYGGISYDEKNADGTVERALIINLPTAVISVTKYNDWQEFKEFFTTVLSKVLPVFHEFRKIKNVSLQYADLFAWREDIDKFNAATIFDTSTKYLPQYVFETNSFWHAHSGAMKKKGNSTQVDNVNVTVADNNGVMIQIVASHKITLEDVYSDSAWKEDSFSELMDDLHSDHKSIFSNLLNDEVEDMIGLNK